MIFIFFILLILFIIQQNYNKIPSKKDHINRNKYNTFPAGYLTHVKENKYIDQNDVIWVKRGFINSILHNPFSYYTFETYDTNKISSSEIEILKTDFDNGVQYFKPASFNYYSSFNLPIAHFFADVLPIFVYLNPKYTIY